MVAVSPAGAAISGVAAVVAGLPVYIAGSSVAAARLPLVNDLAYDDIDLFCASPNSLMSAAERLMAAGWRTPDRFSRVYHRWLRYGFNKWHTNSLKLEDSWGGKVNLVFKLVDGHATTSLAQVIESFDFGLLAQGFDCEDGQWRDMRSYLFPSLNPDGPLPLMPNKRSNWRAGFISQYNGLREVGRYVKYADYGFDMSAVKDDLVCGYWAAAEYLLDRDDQPDKVKLGQIYQSIAIHMESDHWDEMRAAGAEILFLDDLDKIMEALE